MLIPYDDKCYRTCLKTCAWRHNVVCVEESIKDYYNVFLRQTLSSSTPCHVKLTISSAFAANVACWFLPQHLESGMQLRKKSCIEPRRQKPILITSECWWALRVLGETVRDEYGHCSAPLPCRLWNQSTQLPQGEERPSVCSERQVNLMGCLSVLETTGSDWLLLGKPTSTQKPTDPVRLYGSSWSSFGWCVIIMGKARTRI